MKKSTLFYIWGGLYGLIALLSLIPAPSTALRVVLVLLSLGFFVPPVLLRLQKDPKTTKALLRISTCSLCATFLLLLLNILTFAAPAWVGNVLYYLLLLVGVPGVACGSYGLGLFLWACLLFACLPKKK
ncbi:MAG: hypothetical protein IKA47_05000 [Oscillospiraceae bacterium]|nr:hypothetical protein [Oscillospiraceae bacterium]